MGGYRWWTIRAGSFGEWGQFVKIGPVAMSRTLWFNGSWLWEVSILNRWTWLLKGSYGG